MRSGQDLTTVALGCVAGYMAVLPVPHGNLVTQMAKLSFADKYKDAFWRVVPIPAVMVTGAITVALHPSFIAVVALLLLTVVGGLTEVLIWHRLRLRWTDLPPEAAGSLFEPNRQRQLVISTILLFLAILAKAFALAGGVTTDALVGAGLVIAIYAALVGADLFSNRD